jgi:hypothetical protein
MKCPRRSAPIFDVRVAFGATISLFFWVASPAVLPVRAEDMMRHDDGMRGPGVGVGIGLGIGLGSALVNELNQPHGAPPGEPIANTPKKGGKDKKGAKKPDDKPQNAKVPDKPPVTTTDTPPTDAQKPPVIGSPPSAPQPVSPGGSVPPTTSNPPAGDTPKTTDGKPPEDPSDIGKTPPTTYVKQESDTRCGPDITKDVLRVLKKLKDDYYAASAEKQSKACGSLLDPRTGADAWDIRGLDPSTGGTPGKPATYKWQKSDQQPDTSPKIGPDGRPIPNPQPGPPPGNWVIDKPEVKPIPGTWFTKVSNACAVPRPQCAATVEFFGTCQHAQVVNYVQFGFMLKLCDGVAYGIYQASMASAMNAYNLFEYGRLGGASSTQSLMANAGVAIEKIMEYPVDEEDRDKSMKEDVEDYIQSGDAKIDHAEKQCKLHCELNAEQKKAVTGQISGYWWTAMNYNLGAR